MVITRVTNAEKAHRQPRAHQKPIELGITLSLFLKETSRRK